MKRFLAAILAALALVGFGSNASAADQTINPVMTAPGEWFVSETVSGSAAFDGDGTDIFTILFPMGSRDLNLFAYNVNLALFGEPTTKFDSVTFVSSGGLVPVPAIKVGPFSFAQYSVLDATGPFSVRVSGASTGGYTLRASFEEVSAVPEPETYAMFFTGLAAFGFIAFRKKTQRN